jgi:hypothetical protein
MFFEELPSFGALDIDHEVFPDPQQPERRTMHCTKPKVPLQPRFILSRDLSGPLRRLTARRPGKRREPDLTDLEAFPEPPLHQIHRIARFPGTGDTDDDMPHRTIVTVFPATASSSSTTAITELKSLSTSTTHIPILLKHTVQMKTGAQMYSCRTTTIKHQQITHLH